MVRYLLPKLEDLSNKDLLFSHAILHTWWGNIGSGAKIGWSKKDILGLHSMIAKEMKKREYKHFVRDELDKATVRKKDLEKSYLGLREVFESFPEELMVDSRYICLVGGVTNKGWASKDHDVDMVVRQNTENPYIEKLMTDSVDNENIKEMSKFIWDGSNQIAGNKIPLYKLVLKRVDPLKLQRIKETPKEFSMPVKPRTEIPKGKISLRKFILQKGVWEKGDKKFAKYFLRVKNRKTDSWILKELPTKFNMLFAAYEGKVRNRWFKFEGKIPPNSRYNPTKTLDAKMEVLDSGIVEVTRMKPIKGKGGRFAFSFRGEKLRGKYMISQEGIDTQKTWSFNKLVPKISELEEGHVKKSPF